MNNDSIKENIIRKRTEEGISQEEMARRLDVSRNTYRSIEKGQTNIISRRLDEIAALLNVSVEELVLGYKPIDGTERLNDIRDSYDESLRAIRQSYEVRQSELEDKIASLSETNTNLREITKSKDEIIALLKRELNNHNRQQ